MIGCSHHQLRLTAAFGSRFDRCADVADIMKNHQSAAVTMEQLQSLSGLYFCVICAIWVLVRHSYLSATIGSTLVALRAGTKQAPRATPVSRSAVATYVIVSVAVTPNKKVDNKRVNANAPPSPITTPIRAGSIPCATTSLSTSSDLAPNATRIPISRVRCITE